MENLQSALPVLWDGFLVTLQIIIISSLGALVLGTLLGLSRVSPFPSLKWLSFGYVLIVRNVPAVMMFFVAVFILPQTGVRLPYFWLGVIALTCYFAVFVSDAVMSGFQAVDRGQIEAARALGIRDTDTMNRVILPQAVRSVVPPLTVVIVQLVKVSAVAGAFGVAELFMQLGTAINDYPSIVILLLVAASILYLLITIPLGRFAVLLETRMKVAHR
ncbi:MAG: amino acid ABC transporter permease [Micrococcaceae bacterium]